jgi:hypothetical protein
VAKKHELEGSSAVSKAIHVIETSENQLSMTAYVDAAIEDARGVLWAINLWRTATAGVSNGTSRCTRIAARTWSSTCRRSSATPSNWPARSRALVDELLDQPAPSLY